MSRAKATKEEWHVVEDDEGFLNVHTMHTDGDLVGCIDGDVCLMVDRVEDAALIAAAPDLYRALDNLENDDGSIPDHAWRLVLDALAKASGGAAQK